MYKKTILSNHLRIVTHNVKDRDSVALGLFIGTGGRFENDHNKGSAHFLEHILFKGSKKYSCDEIKESIEGVGGTLNAYTSEEHTCYFAKIPAQHLNQTFDILADMVFHPRITKRDVDKERTVILEEIKMYRDLPQYYVLDLLDELMWPDHPLGKNLTGTFESVGHITRGDLVKFHKTSYFPRNVVIVACGCIQHEALTRLVKKKTGAIDQEGQTETLPVRHDQKQPQVRFSRKPIEQMHLALGMFGVPLGHQDKYTLALLNVILGGNMSSRLFNQVRDKHGLAYSIGSSGKYLTDTGAFTIRAGVDNTKLVAALRLILKELRTIKRQGITSNEFKRAKDFFLGQSLLELEDTLEHMLWMGSSLIAGDKMLAIQDIMKKVSQIKMSDIQRVAQQILREDQMNLAVVGPLSDGQEKDLSDLLGV